MIDSSTSFVVPLWPLIASLASGLCFVIGMVWWVFVTFYRKSEAAELERRIDGKVLGVAGEVEKVRVKIDDLARDSAETRANTAYIRGRLETRAE